MRILFKWMLVIGVLFGLHMPILGNASDEMLTAIHQAEEPDHHHHPDDDLPQDPSHDDHGPQEPHHHGENFYHPVLVAADLDFAYALPVPESLLLRMGLANETIPDDPHLSSDRPPLI